MITPYVLWSTWGFSFNLLGFAGNLQAYWICSNIELLFELSFDKNVIKNLCHWLGIQTIAKGLLINLGTCTRGVITVDVLCLSVYYHLNCYVPHLQVESKVLLGLFWHVQQIKCAGFIRNALFKSNGNIG